MKADIYQLCFLAVLDVTF